MVGSQPKQAEGTKTDKDGKVARKAAHVLRYRRSKEARLPLDENPSNIPVKEQAAV